MTAPAEPEQPPLTSEAFLFDLTAEDLRDVKIRREKKVKGVGTGKFELVPYFYTKPTKAKPYQGSIQERLFYILFPGVGFIIS